METAVSGGLSRGGGVGVVKWKGEKQGDGWEQELGGKALGVVEGSTSHSLLSSVVPGPELLALIHISSSWPPAP